MSMIIVERTSTPVNPPQARLLQQAYRQLRGREEIFWQGRTEQMLSQALLRPTPPRFIETEPASNMDALLEEYHLLVNIDRRKGLTLEQHNRLQKVEEELDDLDEATEEAQWMRSRMAETTAKLDALLEAVRDLAERRSPA